MPLALSLPFVQKRAKRYLKNMHIKEHVSTGCDKLVRDLNRNRNLMINDTKFIIQLLKKFFINMYCEN